MAVSKKIFDALISTLQMHDTILKLSDDLKHVAKDDFTLKKRTHV